MALAFKGIDSKSKVQHRQRSARISTERCHRVCVNFMTEVDLGNPGNSGTPNDSMQLALYQTGFSVVGTSWRAGHNIVGLRGGTDVAVDLLSAQVKWNRTPGSGVVEDVRTTPLPPKLLSPNETTPRNPLLVWNSSVLATSYRVQVATDATFSTIVADTVVVDTVCRLRPLAANTTFFWRVSASNSNGASSFYYVGSFTTGTQIVAAPEVTRRQVGSS